MKESEPKGTNEAPDGERPAQLREEMDEIMAEIEAVLDQNAEEFIKSYVQKGGQGWSGFLEPSFYIGSAMASIVGGIAWDGFKAVITRTLRALRHVPGPSSADSAIEPDGSLNPDFEYVLAEAWSTAQEFLRGDQSARHTLDEATALHWAIFLMELQGAARLVKLSPDQYESIEKAGAAKPEGLKPPQLVARIIDGWLRENPMAESGIY